MTKQSSKFTLAIALLTAGFFNASTAQAHPEMDRYGRDITSERPALVMSTANAAVETMAATMNEVEVTGSISPPLACDRDTEWACGPEDK